MPPVCQCPCHRSDHADFSEYYHAGQWRAALSIADHAHFASDASVLADDPLEAAVACDECRNVHCPALLDVKPPPTRKPTPLWKEDEE